MKKSAELMQLLATLQNEMKAIIGSSESTAEQIEAKTAEIATMKAKLAAQLDIEAAEDAERARLETNGGANPIDNGLEQNKPDKNAIYAEGFYNVLTGRNVTEQQAAVLQEFNNALSSTTAADGGYLIPVDQQTAINELKRTLNSLEELVNIEPVGTLTGSRVLEKEAEFTAFADMTEGTELAETDSPQFATVSYAIKDRGGILPVPNNLLADNTANLSAYLNRWLAKKQVATRNKLIAALLATKSKTAIAGIDDIKTALNVTLDPMISAGAMIITNQDGFNMLDKMKDSDGKYLIQPNPVDPTQRLLAGKVVKVLSNKVLKTVSSKAPVIIGDLKEAITLFDRQAMSLLTTNIGGKAFTNNRTEIRAITREDVKEIDGAAYVYGEITVV